MGAKCTVRMGRSEAIKQIAEKYDGVLGALVSDVLGEMTNKELEWGLENYSDAQFPDGIGLYNFTVYNDIST